MKNSKHKKTKAHSSKRRVFDNLLRHIRVLGITSSLPMQAYPLNRRILLGFFILGFCISGILLFIIYDAQTFIEYIQSIYFCSMAIFIAVTFLFIILDIEKLFKLISGYDSLVHTSELAKKQWVKSGIIFDEKFLADFSIEICSIEIIFQWSHGFRTRIE